MLRLFVGPIGIYLLDFFCSGIQFNSLLSPYLCFISLFYTEQKWKRYTPIIYILWESIRQKVFT